MISSLADVFCDLSSYFLLGHFSCGSLIIFKTVDSGLDFMKLCIDC